ncbi:MAG TPA: hypothetical protein VKI62_08875, partial [Bacteroidota bacterium]|nr:hypothetical protein [Bacteroidota bacterium]
MFSVGPLTMETREEGTTQRERDDDDHHDDGEETDSSAVEEVGRFCHNPLDVNYEERPVFVGDIKNEPPADSRGKKPQKKKRQQEIRTKTLYISYRHAAGLTKEEIRDHITSL